MILKTYEDCIKLLSNNGFKQIEDLRGLRFKKGVKSSFCSELFFKDVEEMFKYLKDYIKSGFLKIDVEIIDTKSIKQNE